MQTWTDQALIAALRSGDQQALAELYDRHAPIMFSLCLRTLGDRREAQDLLHDLFLEVWEKASDYRPERGTVRTWLLIRTRSRAKDRQHSSRLARRAVEQPAEAAQDHGPCTAVDQMAVRAALANLPRELRQVLELRYFAGLTAPEMSLRIGIAEGTVRSRLARGLSVLQRLLNAPGDDDGNEY